MNNIPIYVSYYAKKDSSLKHISRLKLTFIKKIFFVSLIIISAIYLQALKISLIIYMYKQANSTQRK